MGRDMSDPIESAKTLEELGIATWQEIAIDDRDCKLFWKDIYPPDEDCDGFDFHCVHFAWSEANNENVHYETLFKGVAYFDGVRHLYFGSEETDNYGYLYYCDVPQLIKALQQLDLLVVEKCKYVREERAKGNR